jgi:starvation-inducible outer membrane lipoprotein
MKKMVTFSLLLSSALLFSACTAQQPETTSGKNNAVAPAADQKSGDTTKTGTITTAGGKFFLTEAGQTPKEVESYQVDLSAYVGKTVTVTGQYSGDTLFIGSIE